MGHTKMLVLTPASCYISNQTNKSGCYNICFYLTTMVRKN